MAYEIETTDEFDEWLDRLCDRNAQTIIAKRLIRAEGGNLGDIEPVGDGVSEMKINFGPGYPLYFVIRGRIVVILLCGGDKSSQSRDIENAKGMVSSGTCRNDRCRAATVNPCPNNVQGP